MVQFCNWRTELFFYCQLHRSIRESRSLLLNMLRFSGTYTNKSVSHRLCSQQCVLHGEVGYETINV